MNAKKAHELHRLADRMSTRDEDRPKLISGISRWPSGTRHAIQRGLKRAYLSGEMELNGRLRGRQ